MTTAVLLLSFVPAHGLVGTGVARPVGLRRRRFLGLRRALRRAPGTCSDSDAPALVAAVAGVHRRAARAAAARSLPRAGDLRHRERGRHRSSTRSQACSRTRSTTRARSCSASTWRINARSSCSAAWCSVCSASRSSRCAAAATDAASSRSATVPPASATLGVNLTVAKLRRLRALGRDRGRRRRAHRDGPARREQPESDPQSRSPGLSLLLFVVIGGVTFTSGAFAGGAFSELINFIKTHLTVSPFAGMFKTLDDVAPALAAVSVITNPDGIAGSCSKAFGRLLPWRRGEPHDHRSERDRQRQRCGRQRAASRPTTSRTWIAASASRRRCASRSPRSRRGSLVATALDGEA